MRRRTVAALCWLSQISGAKVQIEQFSRISEAQKQEVSVIRKTQAKYNKQGK